MMASRFCPTLQEKIELIEEYENSGMSKSAFAKMHRIPRTSLSHILSSKEKLYDSSLTFDGSTRRRLRKSNFEEIEAALLKWMDDAKAVDIPMSSIILKAKAIEIAKELGNHEFSGSSGWLQRFQFRHGLSIKRPSSTAMDHWLECLALQPSGESSEKICDDSSSVIALSVEEWKNSVLKAVLDQYQPSHIYSLHEIQLLHCFLPEMNSEHKKSKEKITVVLGVNMTGTDKLKPLIVGKHVSPKCFKNANIQSLPVTYKSNPKICMSSELWLEAIKELDKKFQSDYRKVAMFFNNASLLKKVKGLQAIELIFMPPNVAYLLQPLNEEIILNFKLNYRMLLIRDWINAIDDNCNFNPTILDAAQYVFKSWKNVSSTIVQNCFRTAGFLVQICMPQADSESSMEKSMSLAQLFQELKKRGKVLQMNDDSYLKIDVYSSDLPTYFKTSTETEDFDFKTEAETSESDSEEKYEQPPSKKDALKSLNTVKNYLLSIKETTLKDYEYLHQIEHRIINSCSDNNSAQS